MIDKLALSKDNSLDSWKIPLYKIYTDEEDLNLITKIVKRGSSWAIGPEIEEFETLVKNYLGSSYCIALNSGTSALHALLITYGLGNGSEVIVPSFSFVSTANSVLFVNSKPVFADIEETTLGLEPKSIKEKITPKTKAVIPIDYAGLSCNIFEIQKIGQDNGLIVIEDAAEAMGASINGKKIGSVANSAILSFCGNKILTTGEGGAVITNSKEVAEKIKLIRSHGRLDRINYFGNPDESQYVDLGYNWRMSSITASLGISQMNKIDKIITMRKRNANLISSRLAKHSQIRVPNSPSGYEHVYQFYTIRLPDKKTRDGLHDYLSNKRIFSKVYFNPIHLTSFYMERFGTKRGMLPVTERISDQVLTLPLFPNMNSEEIDYMVGSISEYFESKN